MLRESHVRKDIMTALPGTDRNSTVLPGRSHPSVKRRVELVRQVRQRGGGGAYRLPTAQLPEHCTVARICEKMVDGTIYHLHTSLEMEAAVY